MDLFVWDQSLAVEIAEIDEQHKVLVGLLNKLHKAMREGKGSEVISAVLCELLEYTDFHFSTEENYFAKFKYPSAKRHTIAHDALRKKVAGFKSKYDNGELKITIDVMFFLKDWLKKHIMESDKRYVPFLKEQGML